MDSYRYTAGNNVFFEHLKLEIELIVNKSLNMNIRGIVDLDQLAGVLENLLVQVDHQNKVIFDLKSKLTEFVSIATFVERCDAITNKISKNEFKMEQILVAATAKYNGRT